MVTAISRRHVLTTGAAVAAAGMPLFRAAAAATAAQRLTATTRSLDVNGKAVRVFGLIGPGGKSGLTLAPGEAFRVDLANTIDAPTIIHWHGQMPPWMQDGFPWPQVPALPAGTTRSYDYQPIPGTYWMHSHHGLQEQSLMTAPLIVQSADQAREDRLDVVMMLHDFSFRAPLELLAGLTGTTVAAAERMATQLENVPSPRDQPVSANGSGAIPAGMSQAGSSAMAMPRGAAADLNDIDYDAFLANERTLADPEVVRVSAGARVRLRIINAASSSQFWIDLGRLTGQVVAVDGHPVHPVAGGRFPLAIAQRLDILLDLAGRGAFPILAEVEGRRARTGIILATADARVARIDDATSAAPALDNSLEARLSAADPLPARATGPRPPDRVFGPDAALFMGAERTILARDRAADAAQGAARRNRADQPDHDAAPDAPARPHLPGDRLGRQADRRGSARHRPGAAAGTGAVRLRCGQSGPLGVPLPQPLPHGDGDDHRVPL